MKDKKDKDILGLLSAEAEYNYIENIISQLMKTNAGLDDERLGTLIEERDKLHNDIITYEELLGLKKPEKEKNIKKR